MNMEIIFYFSIIHFQRVTISLRKIIPFGEILFIALFRYDKTSVIELYAGA